MHLPLILNKSKIMSKYKMNQMHELHLSQETIKILGLKDPPVADRASKITGKISSIASKSQKVNVKGSMAESESSKIDKRESKLTMKR